MARFNVYVSDDLKRRMTKVRDVSWSQIACEAFERKLGEIAAQKKEKTMDDVIQRLRVSLLECDSATAAEGRKAGYEWARTSAEAVELKTLARRFDRTDAHERDFLFIIPSGCSAYGGAELFVFAVWPDTDGDRGAAHATWETILRTTLRELPEDEYVQAFAEGALQLWDDVADKL